MTVVLIRPDGWNRSYDLTRRQIVRFIAGASTLLIVIGLFIFVIIHQHLALRQLREEQQLLLGREILAISPQPAGAENIPGAAQIPEEMVPEQRIEVAEEEVVAAEEPQVVPADSLQPPVTRLPVRLEGFQLTPLESERSWQLDISVTKREWNDEVLRGFVVIIIEDAEEPGSFFTQPPLTIRSGRPITPQAGRSFEIQRLRPLQYEFTLPEGFVMREVRIQVYDRNGEFLLERVFPAGAV